MTGRTEILARTDRVLAALHADVAITAQQVADAVGTMPCWCLRAGHPGWTGPAGTVVRQCQNCVRDHGGPGWRYALVSDVRPILKRLEARGEVVGERTERPVRTSYRLAAVREPDHLDDMWALS